MFINQDIKWGVVIHGCVWLVGCMFESNCPLVGPGTTGGAPTVGVFLRDPSPYLREFQRKTPNS